MVDLAISVFQGLETCLIALEMTTWLWRYFNGDSTALLMSEQKVTRLHATGITI
jgi:hypothetical protein